MAESTATSRARETAPVTAAPDTIPVVDLCGKRAAMVLFSYYPEDPRPRRAAEALASSGMTVDLICLQEHSGESKHETLNGVAIRRVAIRRRRGGVLGYLYQYS